MALKFITLTLFVAAVCAQQQQSALGPALIQQQAANPNQSAQQNQSQQHRDEHQQHQQQQQHPQPQHPQPQHPQPQQQNEHHQQQQHQQQQQQQQHHDQADRYEHDPQYDYSYIVQDNLTGDNKQQEESRRGGRVRGQYSLIDADGFRRIVDYRADDHTGFNAEVRREPIGHGRVQRIEQRIEQIDRQSQQHQQHHNNQQSQQNQQNANNQHHSIEQSRQSVQNTFQRIEVPASAFPRSVYTVQEFVAPSYSAVRQSVHTNRQDDNQNQQNQQNQQQNQQQQHQESRYQARLTFRSPGINYQY